MLLVGRAPVVWGLAGWVVVVWVPTLFPRDNLVPFFHGTIYLMNSLAFIGRRLFILGARARHFIRVRHFSFFWKSPIPDSACPASCFNFYTTLYPEPKQDPVRLSQSERGGGRSRSREMNLMSWMSCKNWINLNKSNRRILCFRLKTCSSLDLGVYFEYSPPNQLNKVLIGINPSLRIDWLGGFYSKKTGLCVNLV